jgi:hypothetical protein
MSSFQTNLTNRSQALFDSAYDLALAGQHRESDEMLELAHTMRELEYQLCEIASHAPDALAELLVKEALSPLDEGAGLDSYASSNRETLTFYAQNDSGLRELIEAVRNPKPYIRAVSNFTNQELDAARAVMQERINQEPHRGVIGDPVITPAAIALKARGYTEFLSGGRCTILRECPDCKSKYSTKAHMNNRIVWMCPHCNTLKDA